MRLSISLVSILALLGAPGAGCDGGNACKSACKKIAKCSGAGSDAGASSSDGRSSAKPSTSAQGATCGLTEECSPLESCLAGCIEDASCAALTGKDATEAKALLACQSECRAKKFDSGTSAEGGAAPDGGPKPDRGPCKPNCSGRQCGLDGCGGTCGSCPSGLFCNTSGQCTAKCQPNCGGRECGLDGCGGTCGSCPSGLFCTTAGQCKVSCQPSCGGKQCGDDGCGGSCGSCASGGSCNGAGQCVSTNLCTIQALHFDAASLEGVVTTNTDAAVGWQVVSKRYSTPSYALYYGNTVPWNYQGSGANSGSATLPPLTLPAGQTAKLVFALWMDTETGSSYDTLKLVVGSQTVWAKGSNVQMKTWQELTVDLSAYAGQTVQPEFEFDTVDSSGNTGEGVFLDAVRLQVSCP